MSEREIKIITTLARLPHFRLAFCASYNNPFRLTRGTVDVVNIEIEE